MTIDTLTKGFVAVRTHFMWRERFVVVRKGLLAIHRSKELAQKPLCTVDLNDPSLHIVFHANESLITLSREGKETLLDCKSCNKRDEWLAALFSAQESSIGEDSEEETEEEEEDGEEEEPAAGNDDEEEDDDEDDGRNCSDSEEQEYEITLQDDDQELRTLLEARNTFLQSDLTESESEIVKSAKPEHDLSCPRPLPPCALTRAISNEQELRLRYLRQVVEFIQTTVHGGRVVLLQLQVLKKVQVELAEIVKVLGAKQLCHPRRSSFTSGTPSVNNAYGVAFVHDVLSHPVYSKRPECASGELRQLIEQFFPQCRLNVLVRRNNDAPKRDEPDEVPPTPTTSLANKLQKLAAHVDAPTERRKRHSFPNILVLPTSLLQKSLSGRHESMSGTSKIQTTQHPSQPVSCHSQSRLAPLEYATICGPCTTVAEGCCTTSSGSSFDPTSMQSSRDFFWNHSCRQLSEQLTLFHQRLFEKIVLWQFVGDPSHWSKPISADFNRLVTYFVWVVLVEESAKARAQAIERIISVAKYACAMNNFHLVMACVGCLGDLPLMTSRLPATWKRVGSRFKVQLQELRSLCNHSGGFEMLRKRQQVQSMMMPCVPFVGVITVALERLRVVNNLQQPSSKKLHAPIDMETLERQYFALQPLENSLQKRYELSPVEHIQEFLLRLDVDFATSRLLQLRSQQILARESNGAALNGSAVASASSLSFRMVSQILKSEPHVQVRVSMYLDALLHDPSHAECKSIQSLWSEIHRKSWSPGSVESILTHVRTFAERLVKSLVTSPSLEMLSLPELDSTALLPLVHHKTMEIVVRPVQSWLWCRAKTEFQALDRDLHTRLQSWAKRQAQDNAPVELTKLNLCVEGIESAPLELARRITQLHRLVGTTNQQDRAVVLLGVAASDNSLVRHLHSNLVLLQQLFSGSAALDQELQQAIDWLRDTLLMLQEESQPEPEHTEDNVMASFTSAA